MASVPDPKKQLCRELGPMQCNGNPVGPRKSSRWDKASANAQNPLHPFPRSFPVDGEVANLLQTSYAEAKQRGSWCNGFWP